MSHKQVEEMDILFIDYHYKSIVSIIRERHVLTLHLSTANCRRKLTTGYCCKNMAALYCTCSAIFLPDRVIPQFLKLWSIFNAFRWNNNFTLLYRMLPRTVSVIVKHFPDYTFKSSKHLVLQMKSSAIQTEL